MCYPSIIYYHLDLAALVAVPRLNRQLTVVSVLVLFRQRQMRTAIEYFLLKIIPEKFHIFIHRSDYRERREYSAETNQGRVGY